MISDTAEGLVATPLSIRAAFVTGANRREYRDLNGNLFSSAATGRRQRFDLNGFSAWIR